MTRKHFLFDILSMAVALLAVSCSTVSDDTAIANLKENPYRGHAAKPLIIAVYHPYPDFATTVAAAVRPLPGYDGWSDSRMDRDMRRMRDCGINGVLLSIKPEDLADAVRFARIRRFYELAAMQQPVFNVALMLGGNNELALGNVLQFIQRKGLADFPSAMAINGRKVVVFNNSVRLSQSGKDGDETFCYRHIGKDWPTLPEGKLLCRPSATDGFVWVKAGDNHAVQDANGVPDGLNEQEIWSLPRDKGRNFANRLRHALKERAAIIGIQSWNDFSDGSFMEPNTLDRNIMTTVLQRELGILAK